jgi:hypothetical protein
MKQIKPTTQAAGVSRKSTRGSGKDYAFMRSPSNDQKYEVGDAVDAFCDHEKGTERVRGWLKGIIVQIDNNKMAAVQFRSNVFLTDGWMVPDHILWFPMQSEQVRPYGTGKKVPLIKKIVEDE